MYLSIKQLAAREGVTERTIYRHVERMEATGLYPEAVKQIGGLKVDPEAFDRYATRERRMKREEGWKKN